MQAKKFSPRKGPEAKIQAAIVRRLTLEGWYVMVTHGNMFQSGFPDLYATHSRYGPRWIEVKNPLSFKFTPAQMECFPKLSANGTRIWILVSDSDEEYAKLFQEANWYMYLLRTRSCH